MGEKIAIIGCGNLGKSIADGLLQGNFLSPSSLTLTKRNTDSLLSYAEQGVQVTSDNKVAIAEATMIILALKPYNVLQVLASITPFLKPDQVIISLATGVELSDLQSTAKRETGIYRAMPNTATHVQKSITAICSSQHNEIEIQRVKSLFETLGAVLYVDEELMAAVTVLGACGIAYVMRFIRAMVQGGIQIGFSAEMASTIVKHTVNGASELLLQGDTHPEMEIDKVTTPKGCTIVGLNEMEHNGFSSALIKGIVKSFDALDK
jgi:pyrroline-5-carboxylate reductase